MSLYASLPVRSYIAAVDLPAYARVAIDGTGKAILASATVKGVGVTETNIKAGEAVSVRLFTSTGSAFMLASDAIAAHAVVRATANGRIDDSGTGPVIGYAGNAASGADSVIEVLLVGHAAPALPDTLTALTFTAGGATGPEVEALRDAVLGLLQSHGLVAIA